MWNCSLSAILLYLRRIPTKNKGEGRGAAAARLQTSKFPDGWIVSNVSRDDVVRSCVDLPCSPPARVAPRNLDQPPLVLLRHISEEAAALLETLRQHHGAEGLVRIIFT